MSKLTIGIAVLSKNKRCCACLNQFKRLVKTYLFKKAFNLWDPRNMFFFIFIWFLSFFSSNLTILLILTLSLILKFLTSALLLIYILKNNNNCRCTAPLDRNGNGVIITIIIDCKTVRIFAYSSTREQSNKRSGTRLFCSLILLLLLLRWWWWNGGHVGVPNQSYGSWTLFLCKRFLLFQ